MSGVVVAVGDIHGRFDLYQQLRAKILNDLKSYRKKKIIFLGDFIDRGPSSKEVVDSFLNNPLPGFEHIFLTGNHEQWLTDVLNNNFTFDEFLAWLLYGGIETMQSYGINVLDFVNRRTMIAHHNGVYGVDVKEILLPKINDIMSFIPDDHRKFYKNLKVHYRFKKYFFVHAGIDPYKPIEKQDLYDFLMIRETFLNSTKNYGFKVVHGHSPSENVDFYCSRIGVDTGAFYSNKLSAVVLTDKEEYVLNT